MSELVSGDTGSGATAVAAPSTTDSPSVTSAPSSSGASTTATPTEAASTANPTEPGPIPFARHKEILEKARGEAKAFEWAKGLRREQVERAMQMAQMAESDPVGFYKKFGQFVQGHPTYAMQLQQTQPDPEPTPDAQGEDGTPFYSATQLKKWNEWNKRQMESSLLSRIAPLEERMKQERMEADSKTYAQKVLSEASTWEGFDELRPRIKALMQEDGRRTIHSAYQQAYREEYQPKQRQKIREEVLAEMNSKAQANTANPRVPSVNSKPAKDKSFAELLAEHYKG